MRLACSELYEQQAFVFRRAYALQFHIEVGADLVAEWGAVPAYASSLAALPGARIRSASWCAPSRGRRSPRRALARSLFSRWLERVAGFPPAAS